MKKPIVLFLLTLALAATPGLASAKSSFQGPYVGAQAG